MIYTCRVREAVRAAKAKKREEEVPGAAEAGAEEEGGDGSDGGDFGRRMRARMEARRRELGDESGKAPAGAGRAAAEGGAAAAAAGGGGREAGKLRRDESDSDDNRSEDDRGRPSGPLLQLQFSKNSWLLHRLSHLHGCFSRGD